MGRVDSGAHVDLGKLPMQPPVASGVIPGPWQPRLLWVLVLGGLLVRAVAVALVPLSMDEAYYADWSRNLAAGYMDHPPAVAFVAAAGLKLLGWTPLGLRLVPLVLQVGALLLAASLVRARAGGSAAVVAVVLLSAMPVFSMGAALALPDAPLYLAWIGTLWALHKALRVHPAWWLAVGAGLGLGALSKLTAGLLGIGVALSLLLTPEGRRTLRSTWPWLGVLTCGVVMSPLLLWNHAHGWPSFAFQANHCLRGTQFSTVRFLQSVAGQVGWVSPLICVLALRPAWQAVRRPTDTVHLALGLASLPVVVFFTVAASLTPGALPHWPAPAWISAVLLLAMQGTAWLRSAVVTGLGVMAAALVAGVVLLTVPLPLSTPVDDVMGWEEAVVEANKVRQGERLAATHWTAMGQLAWHSRESVAYLGQRPSAPAFYDAGPFVPGEPLLVITVDRLGAQQDDLQPWLGTLEPRGSFTFSLGTRSIRTYRFYHATAPTVAAPGLPSLPR